MKMKNNRRRGRGASKSPLCRSACFLSADSDYTNDGAMHFKLPTKTAKRFGFFSFEERTWEGHFGIK